MNDKTRFSPQSTQDQVQELAKRFVDLANAMKDEGYTPHLVNGGLMFASCIYATYNAAGNEGYLHDSGVDKVAMVYRRNLAALQALKKRSAPS